MNKIVACFPGVGVGRQVWAARQTYVALGTLLTQRIPLRAAIG